MSEDRKGSLKESLKKLEFILPQSVAVNDLYEDDNVSEFENASAQEVLILRTDKINFCNNCNKVKRKAAWGEHGISSENYRALSEAFNFKIYCDYCRYQFKSMFENCAHLRMEEHINRRLCVAQVYCLPRRAHNTSPHTRSTGAVPPFGAVKEIIKSLKRP